jgi:hypothetical protein
MKGEIVGLDTIELVTSLEEAPLELKSPITPKIFIASAFFACAQDYNTARQYSD